MANSFQHKLLNYELPPPESAWNNIVAILNSEFDVNEIKIESKLFNWEINPPQETWQNIANSLALQNEKTRKNVIPLSVKRLAIAAIIIGLVATSLWYLLFRQAGPIDVAVKQPVVNTDGRDPDNSGAAVDPSKGESKNNKPSKVEPTILRKGKGTSERISGNDLNKYRSAKRNKGYSGTHISTEDPKKQISITAPLIRDGSGKIILDVGLLTAGNKNYITITGPNGEQTKISSKFLNMVSYLNDRAESEVFLGYSNENTEWKNTFQQWRNKVLQKAAFFPTTNSFLGIVDLKEMIQD